MSVSPTAIVTPAGWTANITNFGGSSDGFAIQWVAASTPADVAPGSSLNFGFDSTDTPSQMAGDSVFFPTTPVLTAFVYSGAPFSDNGDQFLVQSVPEPSTLGLLVVGALGLSWVGWRRRTSDSALS